jgi:hypothetical protein
MVVVDDLDEWLDLGLSFNFLGAHSSGYLQWVSLNAGNEGVWEFLVLLKQRPLTKQSTKQCALTFFPSSYCFTMMAFFPACLPASKITTLPAFILHKEYQHQLKTKLMLSILSSGFTCQFFLMILEYEAEESLKIWLEYLCLTFSPFL